MGYLALRHSGTVTVSTLAFTLGFTAAGLIAAVFPWRLPWLPLLAPFAVLGLYIVAVQPFLLRRAATDQTPEASLSASRVLVASRYS